MVIYLVCVLLMIIFFFFKQKTAYDRRISDWSSDVCSSDLSSSAPAPAPPSAASSCRAPPARRASGISPLRPPPRRRSRRCRRRGRCSDRKRVVQGQSVSVSVDLGGLSIIHNNSRNHTNGTTDKPNYTRQYSNKS